MLFTYLVFIFFLFVSCFDVTEVSNVKDTNTYIFSCRIPSIYGHAWRGLSHPEIKITNFANASYFLVLLFLNFTSSSIWTVFCLVEWGEDVVVVPCPYGLSFPGTTEEKSVSFPEASDTVTTQSPESDPASLQQYFSWRVIEYSALSKALTFSWGHRNQGSTINNLKQLLGSGKNRS